MSRYRCFIFRYERIISPLDLFICNQYDNNKLLSLSLIRNLCLWVVNLIFPKIFQISQRRKSGLPAMHMNSEKRRQFFYLPGLVSIWSLLASLLADPKPASAASKPSSVQTVPELTSIKKSAAAGDGKICPLSRKPSCLNHSSKRHAKAFPWLWPISVRPMKPLLVRKFRLPQSIGCWRVMDGVQSVRIVQWTQVECNCHERFEQIFHLWLSARQPEFGLGNALSNPARFCSCRSYRCASGGDC